jgi:hypothetical protein
MENGRKIDIEKLKDLVQEMNIFRKSSRKIY